MSAYASGASGASGQVPGQGSTPLRPAPTAAGAGSPGDPGGPAELLHAARQEVAGLREVFEAIQDALVAAAGRLEVIESQLGGAPGALGALGALGAPGSSGEDVALAPLPGARSVAEWKLAGWTPSTGGAVVTGETLRARREALGISQAAVAHAAHCSRGLVAEVERGKRRSSQTLAHLASVLDKLEQQARRN